MNTISNPQRQQNGVVSLFVVIFAALLMTVLTIGFLRLMIQEQQQATNNDLSQSAYDSAVAGVEDGKRVLRACQLGSTQACDAIGAKKCSTVQDAQIITDQSSLTETTIRGQDGDTSLNQAYTCVKIITDTDDYVSDLRKDTSQVVRLDALKDFSYITVEWTMHGKPGGESDTIAQPTLGNSALLPKESEWSTSAPSLLRVQAVVPPDANNVSFDELNTNVSSTHFLRPLTVSATASSPVYNIPIRTGARAAANDANVASPSPYGISCSNDLYTQGGYACRASFTVQGGVVPAHSKVAFLRLTSLYRDTSVRIKLYDRVGGDLVKFDDVQPIVDSTGRAGNVFRRVASRVEPTLSGTASLPYPENAVDITGSLCKSFYITDSTADSNAAACATAPSN